MYTPPPHPPFSSPPPPPQPPPFPGAPLPPTPPRVYPPDDSPGVTFPPALYYLLTAALTTVLDHYLPSTAGPPELRVPAGMLLLCFSLVASSTTLKELRAANVDIRTDRPASQLLTTGVYGFSRNPMYLALTCGYASAAFISNDFWMLCLLPVVFLIVRLRVVDREEAYLERRFGQAYLDYCTKVRRWI